eukprot:TRINITY_DN12859_c1_g2_i1.p1 TRINITY_DN12859_c1_g2~~TRINITY_DN12859_c1_g2_i1.p1  ORF type:complete len:401 (+),score=62.75 TRINITY_DN12859_c1_g2_i1:55-1203(+)
MPHKITARSLGLFLFTMCCRGNSTSAPENIEPQDDQEKNGWIVAVIAVAGLLVLMGLCGIVVWRKLGSARDKELEQLMNKKSEGKHKEHPLLTANPSDDDALEALSDTCSISSHISAKPPPPSDLRITIPPTTPGFAETLTPTQQVLTPMKRRHRFNSAFSNASEDRRRAIMLDSTPDTDLPPDAYDVEAPEHIMGRYSMVANVQKNEMPIWANKKRMLYLTANRAGRWRVLRMTEDNDKDVVTEYSSVQKHKNKLFPHQIINWRNGDGADDPSVRIRPLTIHDLKIDINMPEAKVVNVPKTSLVQQSAVQKSLSIDSPYNDSLSSRDKDILSPGSSVPRGILKSPRSPNLLPTSPLSPPAPRTPRTPRSRTPRSATPVLSF